jgi:hypothetical protein
MSTRAGIGKMLNTPRGLSVIQGEQERWPGHRAWPRQAAWCHRRDHIPVSSDFGHKLLALLREGGNE